MGSRPRRRRRAARKLRLRRWLRRQDRFTRGLMLAVVALSVLVVALVGLRGSNVPRQSGSQPRTTPRRTVSEARATPAPAPRAPADAVRREPPPSRPSSPPKPLRAALRTARAAPNPPHGPRAAIVIDDLGQSLSHLEQLADLNIPLTIAVIPGLPATARTVSEATRRGLEMLLHQPMEPHEAGGKNPGGGVLLTTMTVAEVRAQLRANLATVPGAVGVNNHMGSRFTEDADGIGALMEELKDHGLFWLDSKTTGRSRGAAIASAAGVPALERDIFLDAEVSVDVIRRQLRRLVETAQARGTAVGIGHPHPETIAVLREMRPELLASGVTLVPVSALVRKGPADERLALAASTAAKIGPVEPAAARKAATP